MDPQAFTTIINEHKQAGGVRLLGAASQLWANSDCEDAWAHSLEDEVVKVSPGLLCPCMSPSVKR